MRRALGCVIMLASVIFCFTVLGTIIAAAGFGDTAFGSGATINIGEVGLVLAVSFIAYMIGLILFTSIRRLDAPPNAFQRWLESAAFWRHRNSQ
ncbi:MAG TPA: hypothetical protein VKQ36_16675 [Ktedonobacterales bacterium]|nr:hypothetical protein [Ktedonobacterales bacterium]